MRVNWFHEVANTKVMGQEKMRWMAVCLPGWKYIHPTTVDLPYQVFSYLHGVPEALDTSTPSFLVFLHLCLVRNLDLCQATRNKERHRSISTNTATETILVYILNLV
jgi:hypothetical protein